MKTLLIILLTITAAVASVESIENMKLVNNSTFLKKINKMYINNIDRTAEQYRALAMNKKDFKSLLRGRLDPRFAENYEKIKRLAKSGNTVAAVIVVNTLKLNYNGVFRYYQFKRLAPKKNIVKDYGVSAEVLRDSGTCTGDYIYMEYLYDYFDLKDALAFAKERTGKCEGLGVYENLEGKIKFRAKARGLK
jgi:hypothetical protein